MSSSLDSNPTKPEIPDLGSASAINPQLASRLRALTPARVGLRKTGVSLETSEVLDFQLAHARARDAVHAPLDASSLIAELRQFGKEVLLLHSAAADRSTYLQRPDLGRKLDSRSRQRLLEESPLGNKESRNEESRNDDPRYDLSFVVADGLSALAVERNATPLLAASMPLLALQRPSLRIAPIAVVEQARVAIGDEIGRALSAAMVVVLIGERPGLSSPDSLGIYITWLEGNQDRVMDADRNCISNVRSEGLSYADAAARLWHYIQEARRARLTGVSLKDPEPATKALPRGDDAW